MTFETAFKQGYVSKTRKYLFPIINTYPQYLVRELSKTGIRSVALIDKNVDDTERFYVICDHNPNFLKQFNAKIKTYRLMKLKKFVFAIEILDKWKPLIPLFKEGKYSELYKLDLASIGIYPDIYGQDGLVVKPNSVYHVLRKTELGKRYFIQKLKDRKLVTQNFKTEDFDPPEYDFSPKEYDLVLN